PLLRRGLLGELRRLVRVRHQDSLGGHALPAAPHGAQALPRAREHPPPLLAASLRVRGTGRELRGRAALARALDGIAALLGAAILGAFVAPYSRPEDLFVALVLVAGLRHLLRPIPVPAFSPRVLVTAATVAYAL